MTTTTARWRALQWFADHAADINSVFGRRMPSNRMRNRMIRDGQLARLAVGSFAHHRFELTTHGQAVLAGKRKRKPKVKINEEEAEQERMPS